MAAAEPEWFYVSRDESVLKWAPARPPAHRRPSAQAQATRVPRLFFTTVPPKVIVRLSLIFTIVSAIGSVYLKFQKDQQWPDWLLNLSIFSMTVLLATIGWQLDEDSCDRKKCELVMKRWGESGCDREWSIIEEKLFKGEIHYNGMNQANAVVWRLALRALSLVDRESGQPESGEPKKDLIHAKRILNQWAEDAQTLFQKTMPKATYMPVLQRRARYYLYFALPLNWAWALVQSTKTNPPNHSFPFHQEVARTMFTWAIGKSYDECENRNWEILDDNELGNHEVHDPNTWQKHWTEDFKIFWNKVMAPGKPLEVLTRH